MRFDYIGMKININVFLCEYLNNKIKNNKFCYRAVNNKKRFLSKILSD